MYHGLVECGLVTANQLQNAHDLAGRIGGNTGSELVFSGAMGASGYAEFLSAATGLDRISNKELASSLILSDVSDISAAMRSSYCPIVDQTNQWSYAFCIPQYPRRAGAAAARHELSAITTRQEFGDACRKIMRRELTELACNGFLKKFPEFSSARGLSISQFAVMFAVVVTIFGAIWVTPGSAANWLWVKNCRCWLWVKSCRCWQDQMSPLLVGQRTSTVHAAMSALCQERTLAISPWIQEIHALSLLKSCHCCVSKDRDFDSMKTNPICLPSQPSPGRPV